MDDQQKLASKFGIHQSLLEAVNSVIKGDLQEEKQEFEEEVDAGNLDKADQHEKLAKKHRDLAADAKDEDHRDGLTAHRMAADAHAAAAKAHSNAATPEARSRALKASRKALDHSKKANGIFESVEESAGSRPQDKTAGENNPVMQGASKTHNCAKQVTHEEYGVGQTIFGEHAEPDRYGHVAWYDVQFDHGIEERMPVSEMTVVKSESHGNHKKK